jgi:hypothetical protein
MHDMGRMAALTGFGPAEHNHQPVPDFARLGPNIPLPGSNQLLAPPPPLKPDLSFHGSWTRQEDALLMRAVIHLGSKKWIEVARFVPTRSPKQCRERWRNRLAPTLRRERFEAWEDRVVIDKQRQLGNRWALIAQGLPGRSPGAVKNRWYAALRSLQGGRAPGADSREIPSAPE